MAWQPQLQRPAFRGVPFAVESDEGTFGRRAVIHEYPRRDRPYVEDLGRKAGAFTIEAYVLGPDYMARRDALIAALDQAGPGHLVHPNYGELIVTVLEYKVRHTTAEGGMARFSISAVESGEVVYPTALVNTPAVVDVAATSAISAASLDFSTVFSCDGFPDFVSLDALNLLGSAVDQVRAASGLLPTVASLKADFLTQLGAAGGQLTALIQLPASLAGTLTGLVGGLPALIASGIDALRPLRALFTFGDDAPSVPRTTPSRTQQADNQVATVRLVQRAAVIEAARASSQVEYPSYAEAVVVRDELADALEVLADQADDDRVYVALVDLRTAVVRDINARGASLAKVVNITLPAVQPALVCAYSLYEDAGRDTEVAARNAVRHPGFMPGGRPLEVLANV